MIVVLMVSTGAAWEGPALASLQARPGIVLLRRCVDLADLLAAASTGQADVAVMGADLPGLDRTVVEDLGRDGVRVVGVVADAEVTAPHSARIGLVTLIEARRIAELGDVVAQLPADPTVPAVPEAQVPSAVPDAAAGAAPFVEGTPGRVIAVWGATGAPGRTLLAGALASEMARRGLSTLLIDADPHGGAVAQQWGILDEVSGLLAAARLVGAGTLDERHATVQRRLSDRLRVLTGLPRPDRWVEVRPGVLTEIVDRARREGQVVLDTGFSIEADLASEFGRPGRNDLTREALEIADEVVLVGGADPVGLARLARAIVEVNEFLPGAMVRVVVNRMRASLGWREDDVTAMLRGVGPASNGVDSGVHFLPDDQAGVDRALVSGRLLVESGESALTRAIGALLDAMAGVSVPRRQALKSR